MGASVSSSSGVNLAVQPVSASRARRFVRQFLVEHELADLSDDIELVVSELATNAMLHAQTPFRVSLHVFEHMVLLEVEDGSGNGPFSVAAQNLDTGGRGMAIVSVLSSDWGVDRRGDDGKAVWAEFDKQ